MLNLSKPKVAPYYKKASDVLMELVPSFSKHSKIVTEQPVQWLLQSSVPCSPYSAQSDNDVWGETSKVDFIVHLLESYH